MNKLLIVGAATLAVAGIVGLGTLSASAVGPQATANQNGFGLRDSSGRGMGRSASLESRAAIFGMTADELQTALQTKTMSQIAVEKGMSEETFRTKMTEAAKARWEARGLSSEEIAKRIAERDARHAANATDHKFGSGAGNHMGGYGRNQ